MAKKPKRANRTNRRALFADNIAFTQNVANMAAIPSKQPTRRGQTSKERGAALTLYKRKEAALELEIAAAKAQGQNLSGGQGQTTGRSDKSVRDEMESRARMRQSYSLFLGRSKLQSLRKLSTRDSDKAITARLQAEREEADKWAGQMELLGGDARELARGVWSAGIRMGQPAIFTARKNSRGRLVFTGTHRASNKDTSKMDTHLRNMLSTKTAAITGNRRRTTAGRDSKPTTGKRNKRSK